MIKHSSFMLVEAAPVFLYLGFVVFSTQCPVVESHGILIQNWNV
jgi:hypothetical protein